MVLSLEGEAPICIDEAQLSGLPRCGIAFKAIESTVWLVNTHYGPDCCPH